MQTFVPSSKSFRDSAKLLDNQRLGKQRVETLQIINTLLDPQFGWRSHPAVHMWSNYTAALCDYGEAMCDEWISRGYKDSLKMQMQALRELSLSTGASREKPKWWGDSALHISHKSNLLRKNFEYYKDKFPHTPTDLEYVWPVNGLFNNERKAFDPTISYSDSYCHCDSPDFEALRFNRGTKRPQGEGTWWRCVACRNTLREWFEVSKNYLDFSVVKI